MLSAEVFATIGNGHERAAVDHGPNTLDSPLKVLRVSRGPLNQLRQMVELCLLVDSL